MQQPPDSEMNEISTNKSTLGPQIKRVLGSFLRDLGKAIEEDESDVLVKELWKWSINSSLSLSEQLVLRADKSLENQKLGKASLQGLPSASEASVKDRSPEMQ